MQFGTTELLIILFIVLLIFGAGRIARMGGEIGSGIREFRQALKEDNIPEEEIDDREHVSNKYL